MSPSSLHDILLMNLKTAYQMKLITEDEYRRAWAYLVYGGGAK